jgi:uncharacterized protein
MELITVQIEKPEAVNFILGQAHFIKTVEDLHEAIVNVNPSIQFGLAFSEASGPSLIRKSGTKPELIDLAVKNLTNLGSGHSFIIMLGNAYPINIMPAIKAVREVCNIYCASANPTQIILAETDQGRAILGVIDGNSPKGVETEDDLRKRKEFLRSFGYKQ